MGALSVLTGRHRLEAKILDRAGTDPAYRDLLRTDPRAAVALVAGPLPEGLEVTVVEETPTHLCVVLPTHLNSVDPDIAFSTAGERLSTGREDY